MRGGFGRKKKDNTVNFGVVLSFMRGGEEVQATMEYGKYSTLQRQVMGCFRKQLFG